jgi:RNA polymerase sigma factor for flagellar operon FliA
MTREEACERYRRRVLHLARRTCEAAGPTCPYAPEDLVGYGVIGLLEAFDGFDDSRGSDFTAYATRHIAGRMLDAVRSAGSVTRRDRRVAREIATAAAAVRERLGREPTHAELADQMGLDLDGYWRARGWTEAVQLVPVDEESDADVYAREPEAPAVMTVHDTREALRAALLRLPERERQVVLLYYSRDASLAEIGAILEVTPSRVCQILSAARDRLRKAIGREVGADDLQEGAA